MATILAHLSLTYSTLKPGPCDIFAAGGTPCVAAHSTVRALLSAPYQGCPSRWPTASQSCALYQVKRASDGSLMNISVLPTGFADAAGQDAFCAGTNCTIQRIFDQTAFGSHLDVAPPGGAHWAEDVPVNASRERLTVGGNPVYSAYFEVASIQPRSRDPPLPIFCHP